jgi:hypothetical protein
LQRAIQLERDLLDDTIIMASVDQVPLDMAPELIKVLEPNVARHERALLLSSFRTAAIDSGVWTPETRRSLMLQSKLGILKCRLALAKEAEQGLDP